MNESGKWTDVEYSELEDVTIKKNSSNNNIKLSLRLSPLDVPVAWRYFEESGRVTIEFKYLSATESLITKAVENILFEIGKNSRRIYKIAVDVRAAVRSGNRSGQVSIELLQANAAATSATLTLNDKGIVKRPNARAILNMLEHEAHSMQTAAG